MLDKILHIGADDFGRVAVEVFGRQARLCAPYREYLELIDFDPASVEVPEDIPFLPIEFFKSHRVYCGPEPPEMTFVSSGTGGTGNSRHYVAHAEDYERTFHRAFERFYPATMPIYALLPGYRSESSLIYMVRGLGGRFYPDNPEELLCDLAGNPAPKMLFGVSHALLDLAEMCAEPLRDTIVVETGGMKGRREELSKNELHRRLKQGFGVAEIHSEYGMAELSSQAWSDGGGLFRCPPWMRVVARDPNDPFVMLPPGRRGGIDIIDLANLHSCSFIQTRDVGAVFADGSFTVEGRADRSEIRGCNLLID